MCEAQLAAHPELWEASSIHLESRGPEADLKMWSDCEDMLDGFCKMAEAGPNEALVLALADAYNRAIEERRRAEDLLKLRKVWESRRIWGVQEPESAVRE